MHIVFFVAKKAGVHIAKIIIAGTIAMAGAFIAGRASKRKNTP